MNIMIISSSFTGNLKEATNITITDFAHQLQKLGHGVIIVSQGRKEFPDFEIFQDIPVYRDSRISKWPIIKRISPFSSVYFTLKKIKKQSLFSPDIIHSFSSAIPLALNGIAAKRLFPAAKIIHTIKSRSQEKIGNSMYFLLKSMELITVATENLKSELISKGIREEKIKMIRSHINTAKFAPLPKDSLKKKYSLTDKKIILFYGAMRDDKGTYDLFQSMPAVIQQNPDVLFTYVCRFSNIDRKYGDFMIDNGLHDHVKIITDDVDIVEYVNLADLAVFPYRTLTRTESNPSCVLECLACKSTVITSALEELKEILIEDKDCLMVKPADPSAIAEKIIYALKNETKMKILNEHGFMTARNFSVNKITTEFVEEYEKLLAGGQSKTI
ncbi:MAG: glycosyltransferase family 4 protein [Nanoarchaeota archaeon]